jgi:hypothetical protein
METIWRDPATPTIAQAADRASKLVSSNVIDAEQAQEDLGYSPTQMSRMAERKAAAPPPPAAPAPVAPVPFMAPADDPMAAPPEAPPAAA